jgi:hypothetical protein
MCCCKQTLAAGLYDPHALAASAAATAAAAAAAASASPLAGATPPRGVHLSPDGSPPPVMGDLETLRAITAAKFAKAHVDLDEGGVAPALADVSDEDRAPSHYGDAVPICDGDVDVDVDGDGDAVDGGSVVMMRPAGAVLKRPAAAVATPAGPVLKRPATGWSFALRTSMPGGRQYPKWIGPDGKPYYSKVGAVLAGWSE